MTDTTPAQRITRWLNSFSCLFQLNGSVAADLRAVLADNERTAAQVEQLADWDRADQRRQQLQDERDRAVKLWHEQHKQLSAVRVVADMLAGAALPPGDLGPTAHAIGAIRVDMWHQAAGMIRTALDEPPAAADAHVGQEGAWEGRGGPSDAVGQFGFHRTPVRATGGLW